MPAGSGQTRPELIVVDACAASRQAAGRVLGTLLGRPIVELPATPADGPETVTDYLTAAGRSPVFIRVDDPGRPDRSFGWQIVLELTAREQLDLRPVLLSATPLKRLTQLSAADLTALGFRTLFAPVALTDLLDALADNPHE